jgi:hypothetical protein
MDWAFIPEDVFGKLQNMGVSRYEKILVPFISSFPYGAVGADGKNQN